MSLRWMTVDEVVTLYRRPVGTIHRLASTDRWTRCDDRRPALYLADDVQATFDRLARLVPKIVGYNAGTE